MLTSLRLINFKNHEDTLIEELKPLSVFVGPNAVGKSSILEAANVISRLGRIPSSDLLSEKGEFDAKVLARQDQKHFAVEATLGNDADPWEARLTSVFKDGWWQSRAAVGPQGKPAEELWHNHGLPEEFSHFRKKLGDALYLRMDASRLREPSYLETLPFRLQPDGYGLATVMRKLMGEEPEEYMKLVARLRSVVPSVTGVRFTAVKVLRTRKQTIQFNGQTHTFDVKEEVNADQLLFDTVDKRGVPASMQSDGTLYALGLLTALSLDETPRLVLLDDVETGLHPEAQRKLVDLLRELVGDGSRVQLLMTTHSPYIVDGLKSDHVWVCGRREGGRVHVKPLSAARGADAALKVLTTGELWNVRGESWVAGED